jgi:hypothetical protein
MARRNSYSYTEDIPAKYRTFPGIQTSTGRLQVFPKTMVRTCLESINRIHLHFVCFVSLCHLHTVSFFLFPCSRTVLQVWNMAEEIYKQEDDDQSDGEGEDGMLRDDELE